MRYSQSEKMEIIRLLEESPLTLKQTLAELNINRSTFYKWYQRYLDGGYEAAGQPLPATEAVLECNTTAEEAACG